MKTFAIVGCGKLANIVVDALLEGLLPDYQLIGAFSRSKEKSDLLANRINVANFCHNCVSCENLNDLLDLNPDYIVETASPQALKNIVLPALKKSISIVTLSVGGLADEEFYHEVEQVARDHNSRVHLVSGAIGGFDVLRTISLMGPCISSFQTIKSANSLKGTPIYDESLQDNKRHVFAGNAIEAIDTFPTRVNVAVAASLASTGPSHIKVTMHSIPDYIGDDHKIEIKGDQAHAVINVYSRNENIAGWSVVNTLRNITSSIVF